MKFTFCILFCLFLSISSPVALAQTRLTVSQALDFWITNTEKEVVSAAEAMPEQAQRQRLSGERSGLTARASARVRRRRS